MKRPLKHLNIRISGRVQGVFFRTEVCTQARALGVTGFVHNELDGTVYLEAEGTLQALKQLLAWCKVGTAGARVTEVVAQPGERKHFSDFSIAH